MPLRSIRRDRRRRVDRFLRSLVFVFVGRFAGDVFEKGVVVGRLADDVLFAGPVAEIVEFAAFAAERKFRVGFGVRRLFADGAAEFHAVKNTANYARASLDVEVTGGALGPCASLPQRSNFATILWLRSKIALLGAR